jgi:hypothetical protein
MCRWHRGHTAEWVSQHIQFGSLLTSIAITDTWDITCDITWDKPGTFVTGPYSDLYFYTLLTPKQPTDRQTNRQACACAPASQNSRAGQLVARQEGAGLCQRTQCPTIRGCKVRKLPSAQWHIVCQLGGVVDFVVRELRSVQGGSGTQSNREDRQRRPTDVGRRLPCLTRPCSNCSPTPGCHG